MADGVRVAYPNNHKNLSCLTQANGGVENKWLCSALSNPRYGPEKETAAQVGDQGSGKTRKAFAGTFKSEHIARASLSASAIAHALGGEAQGARVVCPGPGHSKQDRSLSILIDESAPDGFVIHSFAGDDWKACRDHVNARLGGQHARPDQAPPRGMRAPLAGGKSSRIDFPLQLWHETRPLAGTLAERYLASRRITLPDDMNHAIRFHPNSPFGAKQRHPCIVALYRHIHTDAPVGIHRTALTADGKKIERKMLGECRDAAIKLAPDHDVTMGLGIAEGIETALSVMQSGWKALWAVGSAGAIARFPVLAGIESLTVFADYDAPGFEAARACTGRWADAGIEARISIPRTPGTDFNDFIGGQHA